MAATKVPTTYLANWSEDGTNITLPIASLSELTVGEADAATGDIREIVHAIAKAVADANNGLTDKLTFADHGFGISYTDSLESGNIVRRFSIQCKLEPSSVNFVTM